MEFNNFVLTVNSSSFIILMVLALILLTATRFRGENAYAAAIIVFPNVPVYLYNTSVFLAWHKLSLFLFPISSSINLLLMPLLWLFAKKSFDNSFKLKPIHLLHLLQDNHGCEFQARLLRLMLGTFWLHDLILLRCRYIQDGIFLPFLRKRSRCPLSFDNFRLL